MLGRKILLQSLCVAAAALLGVTSLHAQATGDAKAGQKAFSSKSCAACHAFGKKQAGPDLAGVTERRSHDWLLKWLTQTDVMQGTDSTAKALLAEYKGVRMPKQKLSTDDAENLIAYLATDGGKK